MKRKLLFAIYVVLSLMLFGCSKKEEVVEVKEPTEVVPDVLPDGKLYFHPLLMNEEMNIEGNSIEIIEGETDENGIISIQAKLNNELIDVGPSYNYHDSNYAI